MIDVMVIAAFALRSKIAGAEIFSGLKVERKTIVFVARLM
jgi:hypothetical protein